MDPLWALVSVHHATPLLLPDAVENSSKGDAPKISDDEKYAADVTTLLKSCGREGRNVS